MRRELSKPVYRVPGTIQHLVELQGARWIRALTPTNHQVWIINRPHDVCITI